MSGDPGETDGCAEVQVRYPPEHTTPSCAYLTDVICCLVGQEEEEEEEES